MSTPPVMVWKCRILRVVPVPEHAEDSETEEITAERRTLMLERRRHLRD